MQPGLEMDFDSIVEIQKMHSSLAIRIRPSHLPIGRHFQAPIGKLEAKIQRRSRPLSFSRKHVHPGLAEVKKNSLYLAAIPQSKLHGSLHRNPVGPPPLPFQQRARGPQPSFGFFFEDWLVENEMGAQAEDAAYRRPPRHQ